jgi:hypothetical protein
VAVVAPVLLVRTTEWIARRLEAVRRRPSRVPQG